MGLAIQEEDGVEKRDRAEQEVSPQSVGVFTFSTFEMGRTDGPGSRRMRTEEECLGKSSGGMKGRKHRGERVCIKRVHILG